MHTLNISHAIKSNLLAPDRRLTGIVFDDIRILIVIHLKHQKNRQLEEDILELFRIYFLRLAESKVAAERGQFL
jgi:hypothetical protein